MNVNIKTLDDHKRVVFSVPERETANDVYCVGQKTFRVCINFKHKELLYKERASVCVHRNVTVGVCNSEHDCSE